MKRTVSVLLIALAILSLTAMSCQRKAQKVIVKEGALAPDFRLKDLNGKLWGLSNLRGKVVLVNFWASWCPPCREEMPSLQRLYTKLMAEDSFEILGIVYNDDPYRAGDYAKSVGVAFPILMDPQSPVAISYGLTGVPETFIIDKKGILRKKIIGAANFDLPEVYTYLVNLSKE